MAPDIQRRERQIEKIKSAMLLLNDALMEAAELRVITAIQLQEITSVGLGLPKYPKFSARFVRQM